MQIVRDYEISIWEQVENEETKLGIIGSNSMSSPGRAQAPTLTRNTNGTKKLTFYLFYEYLDEIEGTIRRNPYCPLLSNGRKIKLNWKNRWYEFIITNIIEDSDEKKITYTAQDAYITELSRRGFNIELSTKKENSQGTIFELTNRILENSEWRLDEENSSVGPQTLDDVLVELETTQILKSTQKTFLDSNGLLTIENGKYEIPKNKKIYTFYSLINKEDPFFQFYYLEEENYQFNEDGFIFDCPLYIIDKYKYDENTPINTKKIEIANNKGKKLIRSQKTSYNKILDTYVKYYQGDLDNIIGYTKTEYFTDDFVTNMVTNEKEFITDIGWYSFYDNSMIEIYNYPDAEIVLEMLKKNEDLNTQSYLRFNTSTLNGWMMYNTGPNDNKKSLGSLYDGKEFVVRLKYGYTKSPYILSTLKSPPYNKTTKRLKTGITVDFCSYEYNDDGQPDLYSLEVLASTDLTSKEKDGFTKDGDYWTAICKSRVSYTEQELQDKNLGLFFKYCDSPDLTLTAEKLSECYFYIEDCQFFEYKNNTGSSAGYYLPGETIESEAKIRYNYFFENQEYSSPEQIKYIYSGYEQKNYEKIYYDNFPQIKTVEGKESNIFNLIQSLCENFDCWADFVVDHDEQGYVIKDSSGLPIKKVCYRPYIGKENWAGYRRGINLKDVNRTLDSSQITTKTIVKSNTNEFAPNGFCTIAYSDENPSGESFIYDFSHYISKGLIDSNALHLDLYGDNGLYKKLRKLNDEIQQVTDKRISIANSLLYNEREKQVYSASISELSSSIAEAKRDFRLYSGMSYSTFLNQPEEIQEKTLELAGVNNSFVEIVSESSKLKKAKEKYNSISKTYDKELESYENLYNKGNELTEKKEKLILNFESKYANFIQEGIWVSEDCIDHNLYYIEAKNIATTSATPKVSYNINVVDISSLEEFFNYDIDIGDKTYIIDPEFFGYLNEFAIKTPKKQEVVITELIEDLENPEKNKTTVQSYKTQFDDLFSRITATAQQLQLNEGAYNRAAGAFSNYGLDVTYTQNSLNNSNFLLQNNTIKWNVDGFVSTNNLNKHQFLKIHNGTIYLTNDGGATWNAAINGKGINANYIYAGQLDAGKINIVSELKTSENQELQYCLTVDQMGLSMYSFENNDKITRLRLGKVVSEEGETEEELYGLQLYNNEGKQTFRTDSNGDITMTGTIYAKDGYFKGAVVASRGEIGGWVIEENQLYHKTNDDIDAIISTTELSQNYQVNGNISADWRLLFGLKNNIGNFGVTAEGNLYANGVDIKDGNISFGDLFKITSNGGSGRAVNYGLTIELSEENKNESVVIESDERIIGIREWTKDSAGNQVLDKNGKPAYTWKTVIGDLSKVTLGTSETAKTFESLKMSGYGICTDNGFFSGYVVAGGGQIGKFILTDQALYSANNAEITTRYEEYLNSNPISPEGAIPEIIAENSESDIPKPLSVLNATGIYLDSEQGYFHFGNKNSYMKFYTNTDKTDILDIKADKLETKVGQLTLRDGFVLNGSADSNSDEIVIKASNYANSKTYFSTVINNSSIIISSRYSDNAFVSETKQKTVIDYDGVSSSKIEVNDSLVLNNYKFANFGNNSDPTKVRIGCFAIR